MWRGSTSTVEALQYSGELTSVPWRANLSKVEAVQYSGGQNEWSSEMSCNPLGFD